MTRLRHGQTCACSLCDKERSSDDVDSGVIDKLIRKSSVLIDGLENLKGHRVPEIMRRIATTDGHMTRTGPVMRANREFLHAPMHAQRASWLARTCFKLTISPDVDRKFLATDVAWGL